MNSVFRRIGREIVPRIEMTVGHVQKIIASTAGFYYFQNPVHFCKEFGMCHVFHDFLFLSLQRQRSPLSSQLSPPLVLWQFWCPTCSFS